MRTTTDTESAIQDAIVAAATAEQAALGDPAYSSTEVTDMLAAAIKNLTSAHGYLLLYASGKKRKRAKT